MKDGRLSRWGGKLSLYGFTNLQQGEYVARQILFLTGLLPLNGLPIILPCVEMESGISADVHIFSTDEGDWVLLLDATLDESQRSLVQQKGNDLSLIRNKQARSLNEHFNFREAENLSQSLLDLLERGERTNVTILLARLYGLSSCIDDISAEEIFIVLNSYLSTMIGLVLDQGGLVARISGDGVMSLFGILPITGSPSDRALTAALRIIEAVKEIGIWQANRYCTLDTGIGIALGSVALGIIGSKNSKTLIAVSHHVNLAEQLAHRFSLNHKNLQLESNIEPEIAATLFQKFSQGKDKPGRTGLGLYFCRITIERWGGNIGWNKPQAGGSQFWFRLPKLIKLN